MCGLFNDDVSISEYTAASDRMNWKGYETLWFNLRFYPGTWLEGLKKIVRNFNQTRRFSGRNLTSWSAEEEAGVLTISRGVRSILQLRNMYVFSWIQKALLDGNLWSIVHKPTRHCIVYFMDIIVQRYLGITYPRYCLTVWARIIEEKLIIHRTIPHNKHTLIWTANSF